MGRKFVDKGLRATGSKRGTGRKVSGRTAADKSVEVTDLLGRWRRGEREAGDLLMQRLYSELQRMAHARLRLEPPESTIHTTVLVHETYLRLVAQRHVEYQDRAHFLALAATMMRRVLVDAARTRLSAKRGGDVIKVELGEQDPAAPSGLGNVAEVLDVDRALERLAEAYPRPARVVEMRFFGGLAEEEIANALGVHVRTVRREWAFASAWLARELGSS